MNRRRVRRALGIALAAALAWTGSAAQEAASPVGGEATFQVETLGSGVHLFRPVRATATHANSLVVDLEDGLLVVEAQPTPAAARDLLAAIRERSEKPVRYLVLTHPHAASSGGADAFPRTTVRIASRGYRDAVADPAFDYLAELRGQPGVPEGLDWERPRASLILFGRTRIEDARRSAILLPAPEAHTPGDLIVFLPDDGIVVAGDLAFPDRAPYAGAARVSGWVAQLNHLLTVAPRRIVPLRGPAMDVDALRGQRDALVWLIDAVDEALADGLDDEDVTSRIRSDSGLGGRLASGARAHLDVLIARVVEERRERRRQMGLE